MKIGFLLKLLCSILICTLSPCLKQIEASEVDKGFLIIDNKPWKISWVKEDETTWVLLANFDKGELRTYFKKAPPTLGFGLSHENAPIKQEFEFYKGKKFSSTKSQYEQWPDGAKGYSFLYEQSFQRDGKKLDFSTTAIIEEVDGKENEIRYIIYKNLK